VVEAIAFVRESLFSLSIINTIIRKRYKESEPLHAKHDRELLLSKADKPNVALYGGEVKEGGVTSSRTSLLSNVCCQDVEGDSQTASGAAVAAQTPVVASETKTSSLTAFVPPAPPSTDMSFRMAILTISDRASQDLYETGDLSGPAVEEQALKVCQSVGVKCIIVEKSIVADEVADIQTTLKQWCSSNDDRRPIDLIFTTGGTGFGPRDVTPEATREILDRECPGLMTFVTTECSQQQPLASLSRGTAGVAGHSLIVNLPGNPKGVGEIMPILLPVILHAVHDLQRSNSGTVEGLE
jgi:molybdopterin adenylyltransferase